MTSSHIVDPGTLRGPYRDKTQNRWKLRWKENGEDRAFTHENRSIVAERRAELAGGQTVAFNVKPIKRFAGTAKDFKSAICAAVLALNAAAREGNGEGLNTGKKYIGGLREASDAFVPHAGYLELEEEFAALVMYVEDIQRGKVDAAEQSSAPGIVRTLKGRAKPPASIRRSGDPIPN